AVQAELGPQIRRGREDAARFAERRAADLNVPEVEEVELVDREAVLEIQEDPLGAEEAAGEEATERVVAAQPLELPERDVALRAVDEAAVQPGAENVLAVPERP